MLHVRRADVWAVGVTEIDEPVFAFELVIAALATILIGQGEGLADCGPCKWRFAQRWLGRTRITGRQGKGDDKNSDIFVHGGASIGLVGARIQVRIF